jgi:hypothetical protein
MKCVEQNIRFFKFWSEFLQLFHFISIFLCSPFIFLLKQIFLA